MPIKTFRGKIADGDQDTITLHTNNGSVGYRIVKFQIMTARPGSAGADAEHTVQIWKVSQTAIGVTNVIDFSDQTLLAAAIVGNHATSYQYPAAQVIWFDNDIFNQDIYITHKETTGSEAINYHIELEQVKLDLNENTVATLKDIRNLS
jgi:hypothetical protein